MFDSVRYERGQQVQINIDNDANEEVATNDEPQGQPNILCTHDGVLLKKASAEHITELNNSGALSLAEYSLPRRRLYIEWHPNENILIADDSQDQGDWALVDTISKRTRTVSECKVFNTKPMEEHGNGVAGSSGTFVQKSRVMRSLLDELASIEVKHRGQVIRFRKSDGNVQSEFFFQHGNAELFVNSMRQLHLIEPMTSARGSSGEEYVILTTETQKLKKTFAELDIGEIKSSRSGNESWLPNKFVGFLINIPEYVQPKAPKSRPDALHLVHSERRTSPENYQIIGRSGSTNSACSSAGSQSRGESIEKTPDESELENVKEQDEKIVNNLPERQQISRGAPLNETQWLEFHIKEGRITDSERIKELIFRGGITPHLRSEVWKYLLNYYQWSDSEVERIQRRKQKSVEYYNMKAQWLSMTTTQEAHFSGYRDRKCQIEKDVRRTDRTQDFFAGEHNPNLMLLQGILMTYIMYNFDLGYVQGMSDLLAPILEVQENEVDAFWCFVGFMDVVFANFDMDQSGMKSQFADLRRLLEYANPRLFNYMQSNDSDNMYFCFRWLLVWFKREFSNDNVLKLWECFWTRLPCKNFQLLVSVAILDQQTDIIIESNYGFNEILKHVNELTGNIDVKRTLELAEAIYLQLKAVETLPNDIRQIIGEPLLPTEDETHLPDDEPSFDDDDDFDKIVREPTPEEKRRQQELLEEACEQSMYRQYL